MPRSPRASSRTSSASTSPHGRSTRCVPGARDLPGLAPVGLAVHIGSQLTELAPFEAAFARAVAIYRAARADGIALERLDLGGGVGIRYRAEQPPAPEAYAQLAQRLTVGLGLTLAIEPGRAIVGNAGVLVSRVVYVKEGMTRRFVIIDAAMNDLIRPALYEAWHGVAPLAGSRQRALPARCRPMWSARSARPATALPSSAFCRRSPPAIWSR